MRFDSIIFFPTITYVKNNLGVYVEAPGPHEKRKAFAEKKSVRQSEFYQAASSGFKPEVTLVVYTREYKGENQLEYNDKTYSIIRSYDRPDGKTELTCEVKMNGKRQ